MKRTKVGKVPQIQLIWFKFFSEILDQNFPPKMGHFGFFRLIKNYAETALLIDQKYRSQVSYTAQQKSKKVESPKM